MRDKYMFGLFPLHVCVVALVFTFFNLTWFIFLINVLDYKAYKVAFGLAMFSAFWIAFSWGLVFYGMFKKSYYIIFAAFLSWTIFVIYWLMVVLIAAFVGSTSRMLVRHRGPDSLWTVYNAYNHDQFDVGYEYYDHQPHGRQPGSNCVNRLSSGDDDDETFAPRSLDHDDDPRPPVVVTAAPLIMRDADCTKWLLIVACFSAYAYLIFGSWYVLFCYFSKIRFELLCVCPAECLLHETCCPDGMPPARHTSAAAPQRFRFG